jgi:hypothetical protein
MRPSNRILGCAACYGLSYLIVIVLAVRKEFPLDREHLYFVWPLSALLFCMIMAVPSLLLLLVSKIWHNNLLPVFATWTGTIVLFGLALVFNAR